MLSFVGSDLDQDPRAKLYANPIVPGTLMYGYNSFCYEINYFSQLST